MFKILLLLVMFNLIGLFRAINLENSYYKFGKGNFYRFISPLGFALGLIISKESLKESKFFWFLGILFNIALVVLFTI